MRQTWHPTRTPSPLPAELHVMHGRHGVWRLCCCMPLLHMWRLCRDVLERAQVVKTLRVLTADSMVLVVTAAIKAIGTRVCRVPGLFATPPLLLCSCAVLCCAGLCCSCGPQTRGTRHEARVARASNVRRDAPL